MQLYQIINSKYGGKSVSDAYAKQKEIYNSLGAPMGNYTGSAAQNNWLLANQAKWNSPSPAAVPAPAPTPAPSGSNPIVDAAVEQSGANLVSKNPVFQEVLPMDQAWAQMLPYAEQQAIQQVTPEIQRQLNKSLSQYYRGLAGRGGGMFAGGASGELKAGAQRDIKSQTLDWLGQGKQAFQDLWYNPTETAYNRGLELGNPGNAPKVPTWNEFMKNYQTGFKAPQYSDLAGATTAIGTLPTQSTNAPQLSNVNYSF